MIKESCIILEQVWSEFEGPEGGPGVGGVRLIERGLRFIRLLEYREESVPPAAALRARARDS